MATDEEIGSRSKDVKWYDNEIEELKPHARELLEKYSGIPPEQVLPHIYDIRDKAWNVFPYPCIGGFRFLDLTLSQMPQYPEILQRIKSGDHLLDLGCCFGQEIRKLIFDGAPQENLHGTDLRQEFFDLGYDLFRDRETCKTEFFASDVFQPNEQRDKLNGTISVVYAGAFFHLFDRPEQIAVAKRVIQLLKPEPGTMVLGRQVGNVEPARYEHRTNKGSHMFRHNAESWQQMWDEVGEETESKWECWVELRSEPRFTRMGRSSQDRDPASVRGMRFAVTRVA